MRGERGHVELAITLAPTVPPLVQTLSVESVLPPAGRLGELAAEAARLASEPDAASLGALLAPGAEAAEALRALRVAAALFGPFGEPEAIGGDGETTSTLRLPGPRGDVDLELALDDGLTPTREPRPASGDLSSRTPRASRAGEQEAQQTSTPTAVRASSHRPESKEPVESRRAPIAIGESAPAQ